MRSARLRAFALVCAALALVFAGGCISAKPRAPQRVLFVGNSLTYYNHLPETFATLYRATHPGRSIDVDMIASGGASLRDHVRSGVLALTLSETPFDLVVLQDIGGWPLCSAGHQACEDSPEALREAVAMVKARGAQPLWYATWQSPAAQRALATRNRQLADSMSVPYADVG
ncbi:MAG: SGNH/GDSL hydrolase family protein, partial [Gammaproteobacteria bacterium]|nr:SGNH/GDSL hydrolase family protein [Gammaproteobacteria bacterium]